MSQKHLSQLIDVASLRRLIEEQPHDSAWLAHLSLSRTPAAGAWLTYFSADDRRGIGTTGVCEIKAAGPYKFIGFGGIDVTKSCEYI